MGGIFRNTSDCPIGIEIGVECIRLTQLQKSRQGWRLTGAYDTAVALPADDALTDEHESAIAQALTGALASSRFRGRRAALGLHDGIVRARAVRQPPMPDGERAKAVALDGAMRLGYDGSTPIVADFLPAGRVHHGNEPRDELIYVGGRVDSLERVLAALVRAGLHVQSVEPTFVAGARGACPAWGDATSASLAAIISIEPSHTSVTLARGPQVAFYKTFPHGGTHLTAAAAERLGVEPAIAHELRRQRMRNASSSRGEAPGDERMDRALFEAARPIMAAIGNEVSLCLRHYGTTFRGLRAEKCILIGPSALEPRLAEFVEDATRTPTTVANPLAGIDASRAAGSIERRTPNPQLAASIGLCLRGTVRAASPARGDTGDAGAPAAPAQEKAA